MPPELHGILLPYPGPGGGEGAVVGLEAAGSGAGRAFVSGGLNPVCRMNVEMKHGLEEHEGNSSFAWK